MPTNSVNRALTVISGRLGDQSSRGEIGAADLKRIVDDGTHGLSPAQKQQVLDAFTAHTQKFGDDYFKMSYGVTKGSLLAALGGASRTAPSTGGNAVGQFLNAQRRVPDPAVTQQNVQRILMSPLPGETRQTLLDALKADARIHMHGDVAVGKLADALSAFAGLADRMLAVFAKTGLAAPKDTTIAEIEQKLMEETMDPRGDIAAIIKKDPWLTEMLAPAVNHADMLANYLLLPSRFELPELINLQLDHESTGARARNAYQALSELQARAGIAEIFVARDLPPPERMTREDAEFVIMHRVNDVRLEQQNGRYTVAARVYGEAVSEQHVTKALELTVGDYRTELRGHKGDWYDANVVLGQGRVGAAPVGPTGSAP